MTDQPVLAAPPPVEDEPATVPASTEPDRRRQDRRGWLVVALITAVTAASWAPYLNDPLGDNRAGRIGGRYAIQLRNLLDMGLFDSHWGTDWWPYNPNPYAHHPPLRNMLDVVFAGLPGDGVYQLRIAPYLLTLLAIPAAAALLRALGIRWVPTLLAVGLMVVTGYYWVYGPLLYDIGPILALSALVAVVRQRPAPSRWLVAATCVVALMATLHSWPGIAFAAALGLWLLAGRLALSPERRLWRPDRVTVAVGASMVAGVAISLAYIVGLSGPGNLARRTGVRATVDVTAEQFADRQWQYLTELLPWWYLALLPVAILAGLANRRTRVFTAGSTAIWIGWVVGFNNGSYVHDYWGFVVLVPGVVGMGALADWVMSQVAGRAEWRVVAAAATAGAVLLLGIGFGTMVFGETAREYLRNPADAGQLVVDNPPAPGQRYAWHYKIAAPRWFAYYWDIHQREITVGRLTNEAQPDDLVLINLERLPRWLPESVASLAVAREGHYALFRAADLLAAAEPESS